MAGPDGDASLSNPTSKSFANARDGKESEPDRGDSYSKQQTAAAERLIAAKAQKESKGKPGDVKAAEGRFDFAMAAEKKAKQPEKPKQQAAAGKDQYRSKTDGKVYTDKKAIDAARAIDKAKADKAAAEKKEKTTHHAPAPKPSFVAANAKRGVSMAKTPNQSKAADKAANAKAAKSSERENRDALAADIAARNAQKKQQAKGKGQNQDKGMSR